ncbi:MAG: hypothetical protein QG672_1119 [Pseudomonadota bacterium]|nr:hypothetical protein [Pseudomonadota bacterium]
MRLKPALIQLGTAVLGAVVGVVIYVGYALPAILPPPTELFMFLLNTDLGHAAIRATSGKAGVLLAHVLRAFPFSVTFGAVAGVLLYRLSSPRLFCYSALVFPIMTALSWWYFFFVDTSASSAAAGAQAKLGELFWVYLWVYGWYFLALFICYAISARFRRQKVA